jgi:hypothetical protein
MSSQSPKTLSAFLEKAWHRRGAERDYFYWELHEDWSKQAVRMGDWKGIRLNTARKPNGPIEFYNLKTYIGKKHNIAA